MKSLLNVTLAAIFVTLATHANALTYQWSFEADNVFSSSTGTVTGTISGLQIGSNDGSSVIVEVLSTPSGNLLGGGWVFDGTSGGTGDAFTIATDGSVTFSNAVFERASDNAELYFGSGGMVGARFAPELASFTVLDGGVPTSHRTNGGTTQFVPSVVPLPAAFPFLAGAVGFFGLLGWRRTRNALPV